MSVVILFLAIQVLVLEEKQAPCTKCDGEILLFTEQNMDNLFMKDVEAFFCTIDESCENNVEFIEYTDELMFKVINSRPEFSIEALSTTSSGSLKLILEKISNAHESADLRSAYSKISSVSGYDKIKKEVLKAIQTAIDNNKVK